MKANVDRQSRKFNPIHINLVIESEDELCELWHRLNISVEKLKKTASGDVPFPTVTGNKNSALWDIIDNEVDQA